MSGGHYAAGPGDVRVAIEVGDPEINAIIREFSLAYSTKFNAKVAGALDRGGSRMLASVREHVNLPSDAPRGPGLVDVRRITGQYYRSWQKNVLYRYSSHPELIVSTGEPRGPVLEYGGPHSNPYPHASLAFDEVWPSIEAEINLLVGLEFL